MERIRAYRLRLVAAYILIISLGSSGSAWAATLSTATLLASDPRPSATATQTVTVSNVTLTTIKCIKEVYATTATGSTAPTGFSSTGGGVTVNTGNTNYINTAGWSLDNTTNGTLLYTLAGGATPGSSASRIFQVDGITNGSTVGTTYYLQFSTYNNTDCVTSPVDSVTIAFVYTNGQVTSVNVDPTVVFTVSGVASAATVNGATTNVTTTSTAIPLGKPTTVTNSIAAQDLTVTTNAGGGYTTYIRYSGPPTSGALTLADHSGTNAAPTAFPAAGNEAFGYTSEDFTLGTGTAARFSANKWAAFSTTNAEVAYNATATASDVVRVGFQIGVSGLTKSGNYTTTVIYTVTPVF